METTAPDHLSHKPIIVVDNFADNDAQFTGDTDAMALSVGKPQWDNDDDLSAKVWRHKSGRWSRQSEEMPVHRALDLSTLVIASFLRDHATDAPLTGLYEYVRRQDERHLVRV